MVRISEELYHLRTTGESVSDPTESESSRWWEFYAVRYAMGTVVGGVVFFFLCMSNSVLKPLLFGADSGTIDGTRLALFAAYGLAYCYIASAPILVFHVGRYMIEVRRPGSTSWMRLPIVFTVPTAITAAFYFANPSQGEMRLFYTSVAALAALLFWLECIVIGYTFFHSKQMFAFYQKLANKRSNAKGGITDSYKHMREHGNSFAIVVFEVALAVLLYAVGGLASMPGSVLLYRNSVLLPHVAAILVWVLPAALVWVVGTLFEREFSGA